MASALQAKIQSLGQRLKEENEARKRGPLESDGCEVGTLTRPVLELRINSPTRRKPGICMYLPSTSYIVAPAVFYQTNRWFPVVWAMLFINPDVKSGFLWQTSCEVIFVFAWVFFRYRIYFVEIAIESDDRSKGYFCRLVVFTSFIRIVNLSLLLTLVNNLTRAKFSA